MIPKFIYQTFSNAENLPGVFKENVTRIRALNPSWEYRLFDDAQRRDFILAYYDEKMLGLYDAINPSYGPARADFFRYLLLYAVGGVYLDIKSSLTKSLDDVILQDDAFITSHWGEPYASWSWGHHPSVVFQNPRGEFVNWYLISEPGHPILKRVIEIVSSKIENYNIHRDGVGKGGVLNVTGPIPFTKGIEEAQKSIDRPQFRIAEYNDLGLIYSIVEPTMGPLGHSKLFKGHYSTLREPVVGSASNMQLEPLNSGMDKIRRNDPCSCGSGKKYKHCHGVL